MTNARRIDHRYQPGAFSTIVTTNVVIMFCGRATPELLHRAYERAQGARSLTEVIDGLDAVPYIATFRDTDVTHAAVAVKGSVELRSDTAVVTFDATNSNGALAAVRSAVLSSGARSTGPSLPIELGMVLASTVTLTWADGSVSEAEYPRESPPAPAPQPDPKPEPEPKPEPDPTPAPEPATLPEPVAPPAKTETAEWRTGDELPPAVNSGYDFVFRPAGAGRATPGPVPPPPPPAHPLAAQDVTPQPPSLAVSQRSRDHDDNTSGPRDMPNRPIHPATVAIPVANIPRLDPHSVLALLCPLDHPNPPHFTSCRQCQAPLSGPARQVTRPVLGTLRLSTGINVPLSQPVVIGSNPDSHAATDPEYTHRVRVPSPAHEISRSHLAIRVDGWHVMAVDLNSTNGTFLMRGGRAPERIPAGSPVLLTSGDAIDIGEGVIAHVEGLP